jgi:hypothetical protein
VQNVLTRRELAATALDRRQFYSIATGSLREVQVILDLLDQKALMAESARLAASLYRLIQRPGGR